MVAVPRCLLLVTFAPTTILHCMDSGGARVVEHGAGGQRMHHGWGQRFRLDGHVLSCLLLDIFARAPISPYMDSGGARFVEHGADGQRMHPVRADVRPDGHRAVTSPTGHVRAGADPSLHGQRRRAVAKSTGPRVGVCIEIVPSSGVSYTVRPGQVLKLPLFNESILDRPRRPRPCLQSPARTDRGLPGAFPGGT